MEKLHMTPSMDHYFRDFRGGMEFLSDMFVGHKITDFLEFEVS
jgi:hypothetical protein